MREVMLLRGQIALVDDGDFENVIRFKWYLSEGYAKTNRGVGSKIKMHTMIMGEPPIPNLMVDHKNRNRLDNQRDNLRWCTHSQNMANSSGKKHSSRFRGVSHTPAKGKRREFWTAYATKNGTQFYLGTFNDELEAAIAYNEKAIELHGEFATLNIVV